MAMTRAVGLMLALGMVAGTALRGDEAKPVTGDLKAVQGTWAYTDGEGRENRWVFDGDKLKAMVGGQEYTTTVKLDSKGKPEPTIDFKITQATNDSAGQTSVGIYKLDGDKFTICVTLPGRTIRPTKFETVEDEQYLFKMKRAK